MHRILLTILCVLLQGQMVYADTSPCMLQAEYRYDAVDFEESASHYLRVKTGVSMSRDSAFNAAVVYREKDRESILYTWNLVLRDISPYVSFIAGHYYVHVGAGLFMGQKSAFNFDVFSPRSRREDAEPVAPANSGNPAYAFYGAAIGIGFGPDNCVLSSRTFYSLNTRYINEDDYYACSTDAGLSSLSGSVIKNHARFEPVMVETYGTLVHLSVAGNLHLSAYAAHAGVNRPAGGHIDFQEVSSSAGSISIRDTTGTGICARYTDNVLSCFLESALSWKRMNTERDGTESVRGAGVIGGITLNHSSLFLSFTGKHTNPRYYAPFAATTGEERPERAWFISTEYRPVLLLALGAQVSDEKELAPSSTSTEPGSARRSTCYARCAYGVLRSAKIAIRTFDKNGRSSSLDKRQIMLSSEWKVFDSLEIDTLCIRQAARGSDAYYASAGAGTVFLRYFVASIQYGRAWASSGNSVYASALPLPQSGISVTGLREACHSIAARCALKLPVFSAHARYFLQLSGERILDQRVELCASGRW